MNAKREREQKVKNDEILEDKKRLNYASAIARVDHEKDLDDKRAKRELNARTWISQANRKYQTRELDVMFA